MRSGGRSWRIAVLAALFLAFLSQTPAESQQFGCPGQNAPYTDYYGREVLTISSTALPFTASKYADGGMPVKVAFVTLESNPIRYSIDGAAPTASVGTLVTNGTNVYFMVCGQTAIQRFLAIRTGSDATLTVQYGR